MTQIIASSPVPVRTLDQGDRASLEPILLNDEQAVRMRSLTGKTTIYPMGLSDVGNSRKEPPKPEDRAMRGSNGLPRAGVELLEDGIVLLYQKAKAALSTLVFWSMTIPTRYRDGLLLTLEDHCYILQNWSEVVKRVFEEISRLYERKGLPNCFLYVVEPQEERWTEYRVFAPHIHALLVNRWNPLKRNPRKDKGFAASGYWEVTTEETDAIVERVFSNLLGKSVDCRAACNIDSVKGIKQLMFYLSKLGKIGSYMSKGSTYLEDIKATPYGRLLPANWYGSDKQTRQEVRASVVTFTIGKGTLGEVRDQLTQQSELFKQQHGRPLFTTPHLVTTAYQEGQLAVALVSRVYRLEDIPIAMGYLMELNMHQVKRQDFYDSLP